MVKGLIGLLLIVWETQSLHVTVAVAMVAGFLDESQSLQPLLLIGFDVGPFGSLELVIVVQICRQGSLDQVDDVVIVLVLRVVQLEAGVKVVLLLVVELVIELIRVGLVVADEAGVVLVLLVVRAEVVVVV